MRSAGRSNRTKMLVSDVNVANNVAQFVEPELDSGVTMIIVTPESGVI